MKRFFTKKKEKTKETKLEAEEYRKSRKFLIPFFEKPITSSSTRSLELPASSLLESQVGLNTNASQDEEEVKSDKSTYEEIESQAARENVDMTGRLDDGGRGEFIDEILPNELVGTEPSEYELDGVAEPRIVLRGVIEQHDIGLLKFDKDTGKAILDYALIT